MVLRKWNARIPTLPSSASIEGKHHDYTKTLHHPRLKHPFPLSQGPIILPLDTNLEPSNSFGQGVEEKTVFSHNETQACAMYLTLPYSAIAKVSSAWNVRDNHNETIDYEVTELELVKFVWRNVKTRMARRNTLLQYIANKRRNMLVVFAQNRILA